MKARIVAVAVAVKTALLSTEVRPAELAILRVVAVAVAAQLGIDVSHLF